MATIVELSQAPSVARLFGKAAVGMLPGRARATDALPETTMVLRGVRADVDRLAEYARVCGFPLTGTMPSTYPHVLAFPLALSLMTSPDFPFPAAGVVHLANRITQYRSVSIAEPLDLSVWAEHLRAHPRGRQVDVVAEGRVGGELVWRDASTYLRKGAGASQEGSPVHAGDGTGQPSWEKGEPEGGQGEPSAVWRLDGRLGRDYAAVSGDRNPIHLSTVAAKAFGFRRRIAHGMWSKARCVAQLGPRLPDAYQVQVSFAAPILLPSTVHFTAASHADGDGWVFGLRAPSGRPHMRGEVRPTGNVTRE